VVASPCNLTFGGGPVTPSRWKCATPAVIESVGPAARAQRSGHLVARVVSLLLVGCGFRVADDLVGAFGPGEWVGAFVPAVDVGPDGGLEVLDGVEGAAADRLAGDDPEEDPPCSAAAGRDEVQLDSEVPGQPGLDVGVLVGGVVVADHVQGDPG